MAAATGPFVRESEKMIGRVEARIQTLQEMVYDEGFDYRLGSPHLKHHQINHALTTRLRQELDRIAGADLALLALEVGAGDGPFVEPLLAAGCAVAVTEMSRPTIKVLNDRFARNPNFRALYDPDGAMASLANEQFALVLYASVLHHIPDYLAALQDVMDKRLIPGGSMVSFQDPLWYPSVSRATRWAGTLMYLSWRLGQGNLRRGLKSFARRTRGALREDEPGDMVEYHVVRNGVDHEAIRELLVPRFERVEVVSYWSTQSSLWQRVGERLHLRNTFAIWASGFSGKTHGT